MEIYLAGLIVMIATWIFYNKVRSYKLAKKSNSFLPIAGSLTVVQMWGKNKERPIHLNLAYEYRYLDTLYTGKNLAFYEIHWPQTGNFANEHTVGQAITVYVDPKNPSTSVLITGRHPKKPYFDMMWSFLCVIIAVGLASAFWINK